MRKLRSNISYVFLVLTLVLPVLSGAQPANGWINYSQQYYAFPITQEGFYRIDSLTLATAGIDLSTVNPQSIQIFGRGKEISLYIKGENDGVFNATDYIEFYAQPNDGWLDSIVYQGAVNQTNPYYSLYNDTAVYYLTVSATTNTLRYTLETDTVVSAYSPAAFIWRTSVKNYNSSYYDGETNAFGGTTAEYHYSEGWFDSPVNLGGTKNYSIPTPNYALTGNFELNFSLCGESDYQPVATGDHHLQVSIGTTVLMDTIFEGYKKIDGNLSVSPSLLSNNTTVKIKSVNDLGVASERMAVGYISVTYPHNQNAAGANYFDFYVDDNLSGNKYRVDIANFSNTNAVIYDITNNKRIATHYFNGKIQALIPNSGGRKKCILINDAGVNTVSALSAVNGSGYFINHLAQIPDSAYLIITHKGLQSSAANYASYRSTTGFNTYVVYVDDLYRQFAYGIHKHPLALRNFIDYLAQNNKLPSYVFLIGKSIKAKEYRKNATNYANNLVPSYGSPTSDILLFAGLNGGLLEPPMPVGRLAAKNPTEVTWYLNKVMQHENPVTGPNGETEWMKRVLHFAGGTNSSDAALFMSYLNSYKATIEDTLFGGNVISFAKNSTAPMQTSASDSIQGFIGDGVALMTFFGHASATGGFDQSIDNPSQWYPQNGKYPVLLGNACLAGDIHLASGESVSEDFVLIDQRGVVAFIASVALSTASTLNAYSGAWYENIALHLYGNSIGESMRKTIQDIQGTGINTYIRETCYEMTLHGDPALKLNTFEKPDYMISVPNVYFTPSVITSDIDSFDVNIIITNLGKAVSDSFAVELTRNFPNQSKPDTTYIKVMKSTLYKDTVTFTLPVDIVSGVGINQFHIKVDALESIDELYETNNEINTSVTIQSGEIIPVYPYKYAIVSGQGITLKANTAFPFTPAQDYVFELDTTDLFNSPLKQQTIINSSGGVVSWQPSLLTNMPDSMVYFWRVSKDSSSSNGYQWRESSFQYIPGETGWGQAHYFQFKNDDYRFVKYNRPDRSFDFINDVKQLKCVTYGNPSFADLWEIAYFIDADQIGYAGCGWGQALHVAVLDSLSLTPWDAQTTNMGQTNYNGACSNKTTFFIFHTQNAAEMQSLANMLTDSVPAGNYILVYTWRYGYFTQWASTYPATLAAFNSLGATQINTIGDSIPYIFFTKKGDLSSAIEVVGDSIQQRIELKTNLTLSADFGNIYSEIVGPASRWDSLFWRYKPLETNSRDEFLLTVNGISTNGNEVPLITNLPYDSIDMRITNYINAQQYPQLKLNAYLTDDSLKTAPQIQRWQVTYEPVPEAAVEPKIYFSFYNDTLQEGENVQFSVAVKNISDYNMDSLLVHFTVLDKNRNTHLIEVQRLKPLSADSIVICSVRFSSEGFPGLNTLIMEVNPNNDQLEQYHFNNYAQVDFFVKQDKINPVLDITFDGIHILDGDIVSAKPEILVQIKDENQYLLLNDTADFQVYLTTPDGQEQRIYFYKSGTEQLEFIPATNSKNSCKIFYRPVLKVDGKYTLRVKAQDRSKNRSGDVDYTISFEVINKSTITEIMNYPNPFSTSTRFVFTLTGSEIPDVFHIQILTISGKVVKEITKDELGEIHIGRNITEYAWDGTDNFGDQLANGVYFYRVITQINGEAIEKRQTAADSYFKKGFGKMYLMR